jgi:hypothetical protein
MPETTPINNVSRPCDAQLSLCTHPGAAGWVQTSFLTIGSIPHGRCDRLHARHSMSSNLPSFVCFRLFGALIGFLAVSTTISLCCLTKSLAILKNFELDDLFDMADRLTPKKCVPIVLLISLSENVPEVIPHGQMKNMFPVLTVKEDQRKAEA